MADGQDLKADSNAEANQSNRCSSDLENTTGVTNHESESPLSDQGACAFPQGNCAGSNNTLPKSFHPIDPDGNVSQRRDFTHRDYASVTGCPTLNHGPILPGQLGDTSQDISLNSPVTSKSATSLSYPLTPPTIAPESCNTASDRQATLQMNIPPSIASRRVNNTDIAAGMAEMQLSFQELPQSVTLPQALPPLENPLTTMARSSESSAYISSGIEDNLTVSNLTIASHRSVAMTARPVSVEGARAQAPAGGFPHLSHSDSQTSIKTEIPDNCQVRKLPKSILKFIATEMEGKGASWEDLVELYNWNYHETQSFATRHPNDVFLALLREAPFQTYTLSQLRVDLVRLPRMDLLCDLNEKIQLHNAQT
ncbi:hypothetical protein EGW08_000500 [Elysia chlorotica]|uniref:Uncharacterized protein n=1 Tax=Elysia chlorotica TaxID=188477 RepID=A0A3S1BU59_ELYCH|nr:hypothetical protein EGW08_000500 [Elysia chlorotica]